MPGDQGGPVLRLRRPEPPRSTSRSTIARSGNRAASCKLELPATVRSRARVAAYLDPEPTAQAKAIHDRPLDEKPYWDVERARIGKTRKVPVEVVVNGHPVARREIVADGSIQDLAFDVPIKKSSWVALRVLPSSHTNPIFVLVDDKPIRASKKSAEWCLKGVDQCWSQKEQAIRASEKDEAKKAYDVARQAYRKIRDESAERLSGVSQPMQMSRQVVRSGCRARGCNRGDRSCCLDLSRGPSRSAG